MGLINFDGSINDTINQRNQQLDDLKAQNGTRFKYPQNPIDPDKLSSSLPFTWKGKQYPILDFHVDITRDLVQHKYPNVDSARVEDMGRNPMILKATLIFVNTISPGPQESWSPGNLYPQAYGQFLVDMGLGPSGSVIIDTLVHPTIGSIRCLPASCLPRMDGKFRGGEIVDATWIETIDDNNVSSTTNTLQNAIGQATVTAAVLDNSITAIQTIPDLTSAAPPGGFSDIVNGIKSVIDQTSLIGQQTFSSINSLIYRTQAVIDACDRLDDAIVANIKNLALQLQAYAIELKETIGVQTQQTVGIYPNRVDTTISNLAKTLNNTTTQLLNLNPNLAAGPRVPKYIAVRFYKA